MTKLSRFSLSLSFRHWSLRSSLATEQTLGINTSGSVVSVAWNSLKWVCDKAHFIFLNCMCACVLAKLLQSCLTLRSHGLWPTRLLCPWGSPGKRTAAGGLALPWGAFPTQTIKPPSPAAPTDQVDSLLLSPQGSPLNCIREGWTPQSVLK